MLRPLMILKMMQISNDDTKQTSRQVIGILSPKI
jgi:hypothetical protein